MARPLGQRTVAFILIVGLGLLSWGCGESRDYGGVGENRQETNRHTLAEEGVVEHPIRERIPHADRDVISIKKDTSFRALPEKPRSLQVLRAFLQDTGSVDTTHLGIFVDEAENVGVKSLGKQRLVIHNSHPGNRLYEYDREIDTLTQIATPGKGPGELAFSMDVMRDGPSVYVARQDRRIDRFNCSVAPCEYEATTRVQTNVMSVSAGPNALSVLTQPSNRKRGASIEQLGGAIHRISTDGTIHKAFGAIYHTEHFMVMANYARGGRLVYSPDLREYILSSGKLPYVWVYSDSGTVANVFRVADFQPLQMEYNTDTGGVEKRFAEGYSTLDIWGPLEGRFIAPVVRHYTPTSGGMQIDLVDYYVLDLKTRETYFVGTDTYGEDTMDRLLLPTDDHQLLVENGQVGIVR